MLKRYMKNLLGKSLNLQTKIKNDLFAFKKFFFLFRTLESNLTNLYIKVLLDLGKLSTLSNIFSGQNKKLEFIM